MEKFDRIKQHLNENKDRYLIGAGALVVGAAAGYAGGFYTSGGVVQIVDSLKVQINSPSTNEIVLTVVRNGRGHPGYITRCIETGQQWSTQGEAAAAIGRSSRHMTDHLNGATEHLNGLHFERVPAMIGAS